MADYSEKQIENANILVQTEGVARIDENTWQVKSKSEKDKSYFVDHGKCDCMGCTMRGTCVHMLAVELYQKKEKKKKRKKK